MTMPVAITGVGAVTPLGAAPELYARWIGGISGIDQGTGRCADFDPRQVLAAKEVRRSDRCTQLAVAAADEAIARAGWAATAPFAPDRVGVVMGTGIGGVGTIVAGQDALRDSGPGRISPLTVPLMMPNGAAGAVSMRHGLCGPSYGTVSACAAGAHAVGQALRMIQVGDADAVVCGGSEAALLELSVASFAAMNATSKSGVSRPFDARRDGFVLAEGAGALVLEHPVRAAERGAPVLGDLLGFGASSDAYHITAPDPMGSGASLAIERALADAGIDATQVDYVNAHGTSTPLNDRAESLALKRALGKRAHEVPVSSLKSAIGHSLGAAGAVEAVATVLALNDRLAPPTLNYSEPDPELDLDFVPGQAKRLDTGGRAPVAISNSFGFGGHNAVLVLRGRGA